MRRFLVAALFLALVSYTRAESLNVNASTRNVTNQGNVNFASGQLLINGVPVSPGGGGGGGGGGPSSIALATPNLFTTPVNWTQDGSGNWTANLNLATQAAFTFFGNSTASPATPGFMSANAAKTALGLSNVENTALSTWPGSANITTLGTLVSGVIPASLLTGTLSASQEPAHTGDVTNTAGSLALTIAPGAVSYTKFQNIPTNRLLGRSTAGSGTVEEIAPGSGLSLAAGVLSVTAGGGTVTNFTAGGLSPLFTTSVANGGTTPGLSFSLSNAGANTFFGNGTGFSGAPTFMSAATARAAMGLGSMALQSDTGASTAIQKGSGAGGLTPASANTDYDIDSRQTIGDASGNWTNGKTSLVQTAALTTNTRTTNLPAANSFAPGKVIIFSDALTTGSFGRAFNLSGSDTLVGATAPYTPFVAGGINGRVKEQRFQSDGVSAWTVLGTGLHVTSFQDPTDATKQVQVVLANTATATTDTLNPGIGTTVTVQPTVAVTGSHLQSINADGTVTTALDTGTGSTIQPFQAAGSSYLTQSGSAITWTWASNFVKNNAKVQLANGANTLTILGADDGMSGELRVQQPASGAAGTLSLPNGFRTPAGGGGTLLTSSANNARDSFDFSVSGTAFEVTPRGLNYTAATANTYNTIADQLGNLGGSSVVNKQGDIANRTYIATKFVAGSSYTGGRADLTINKVGSPAYDVNVAVYADNAGVPNASSPISANTLNPASPWSSVINASTFDGTAKSFTGFTFALTNATTYWLVITGAALNNSTDYITVNSKTSATFYSGLSIYASANGTTGWTQLAGNTQSVATTYKSP